LTNKIIDTKYQCAIANKRLRRAGTNRLNGFIFNERVCWLVYNQCAIMRGKATPMLIIRLEHDWQCEYVEIDPDLFEFIDNRTAISSLADWRFDARFAEGWAAWLERAFTLAPQDECVRYVLEIAAAPQGAQLTINTAKLGAISTPAEIDITEWVHLDDNRIGLRVESGAQGTFGALRLRAVPCD
jgi:hypothetical protein